MSSRHMYKLASAQLLMHMQMPGRFLFCPWHMVPIKESRCCMPECCAGQSVGASAPVHRRHAIANLAASISHPVHTNPIILMGSIALLQCQLLKPCYDNSQCPALAPDPWHQGYKASHRLDESREHTAESLMTAPVADLEASHLSDPWASSLKRLLR